MKKIRYPLLAILIVSFTNCISHSYYLSAFNVNSNPYQAIPLQSDSIKSAIYISGGGTIGGANQEWRDNVMALRLSIHRSHSLGNFHLYYGGNAAIGGYDVSSSNSDESSGLYGSGNNLQSGAKFFGGYGFTGGFNVLVPFISGGEWRVIGLEGSAQNEFGDYLGFRKTLPDSAASIISREGWTETIGLTTEVISKRRSGSTFGYKFAIGTGLNNLRDNFTKTVNGPPVYISNTLHFGRANWIAYMQLNFGTYAGNFQFGVNYRLGKRNNAN